MTFFWNGPYFQERVAVNYGKKLGLQAKRAHRSPSKESATSPSLSYSSDGIINSPGKRRRKKNRSYEDALSELHMD